MSNTKENKLVKVMVEIRDIKSAKEQNCLKLTLITNELTPEQMTQLFEMKQSGAALVTFAEIDNAF